MVGVGDDTLSRILISPGASIRSAMTVIEEGSVRIALMVDDERRLLGTVSDGDLRRALLGGAGLQDSVDPFVNHDPVATTKETDRAAVLDLMRARDLTQIPEVDEDGRLLGLHVVHEVLGSSPKLNRAVILAGGRGTRLGELTTDLPKPMLRVAGRPILERLVLHLVGSGIRHIYLSVAHLAEQIRDHFGDGSELGCEIQYLFEDPSEPLGTGGPLGLLREQEGDLGLPVLAINGDLVASFSVQAILDAHTSHQAAMTIALREYAHDVPFGVAELDREGHGLIADLVEKPRWAGLVNAGIYVIEPRLLDWIPRDTHYPITELVRACLAEGEPVAGWELRGDWQDVGRPVELARARGEL